MSTSIEHALRRAGVDTDSASLHQIAVELLRKNDMQPRRALPQFVKRVRAGGGLMCALHDPCETENTGIEYLHRVAKDMRGEAVSRQKRDGAGNSRGASDGKRDHSSPDNSAQAEGKAMVMSPEKARAIVPSPTLDDGDGKAGVATDGNVYTSSPSSSESSGTAKSAHPEQAKISALPTGASKRTLANMEQIRKVTSVFDSHLLRDGTPVGDLRYCQLDRFIGANAREAELLRLIRDHGIPADPNTRIRDIMSKETMERLIQKSAELTDAE